VDFFQILKLRSLKKIAKKGIKKILGILIIPDICKAQIDNILTNFKDKDIHKYENKDKILDELIRQNGIAKIRITWKNEKKKEINDKNLKNAFVKRAKNLIRRSNENIVIDKNIRTELINLIFYSYLTNSKIKFSDIQLFNIFKSNIDFIDSSPIIFTTYPTINLLNILKTKKLIEIKHLIYVLKKYIEFLVKKDIGQTELSSILNILKENNLEEFKILKKTIKSIKSYIIEDSLEEVDPINYKEFSSEEIKSIFEKLGNVIISFDEKVNEDRVSNMSEMLIDLIDALKFFKKEERLDSFDVRMQKSEKYSKFYFTRSLPFNWQKANSQLVYKILSEFNSNKKSHLCKDGRMFKTRTSKIIVGLNLRNETKRQIFFSFSRGLHCARDAYYYDINFEGKNCTDLGLLFEINMDIQCDEEYI